jgi:hypothetical protein
LDSRAEAEEGGLGGDALDLDEVGSGVCVAGVGEAVREGAVIGEDEEALAVAIEPADGVDAGDGDEGFEGGPGRDGAVGELGEDPIRFIEFIIFK